MDNRVLCFWDNKKRKIVFLFQSGTIILMWIEHNLNICSSFFIEKMGEAPVLYSYWRSSCSWRVRIALQVRVRTSYCLPKKTWSILCSKLLYKTGSRLQGHTVKKQGVLIWKRMRSGSGSGPGFFLRVGSTQIFCERVYENSRLD